MARRRMFSLDIVDLDVFVEMSVNAKLLYYEFGMRADDDGFVGNPKRITCLAGCDNNDIQELIDNKFIIMFSTGVIVIRHWKMNNQLRSDRYKETYHLSEKDLLTVKNETYDLMDNECLPNDIPLVTTVKDSIVKSSIVENSEGKLSKDKLRQIKTSKGKNIGNDIFKKQMDTLKCEVLSQKEIIYINIVSYLNKKINANYNNKSLKTRSLIDSRLSEGYKEEDFIIVIDKKSNEWVNTDMSKYLRPETLFSNKFESYFNQPEIKQTKSLNNISMLEINEAVKIEKEKKGETANDTITIY